MDFESAINSLSELSKLSEIPDKQSEHEMILTQNESSVTLMKMDIWLFWISNPTQFALFVTSNLDYYYFYDFSNDLVYSWMLFVI